MAVSTAVSPAGLKTGAVTARIAGVGLQRVVHAVDGTSVGPGGDLDHDLDRAVEPGAEARGQLVVGGALRRVLGRVAVVGLPMRMLSAGIAIAHNTPRLTSA